MPEHVHLLVNEPGLATLSTAIQALKISVSRRSQPRPFWQPRYYDFNVWSARKISEKLRYIHRNPVTRGLVAKPEDWKWSSYRHYQTGASGTVEIESDWTARQRGWQLPAWMALEKIPAPKNKPPESPSSPAVLSRS
jgi:putative transposase